MSSSRSRVCSVSGVCLFVLLCCLSSCFVCDRVDASSYVDILAPANLARNGIDHRPAVFGNPKYGGFTNGVLYYPKDPNNQLGCDPIQLSKETVDRPNNASLIWMLRRSGPDDVSCHFITKVRHAVAVGAVAVVIWNVDGVPLPYMKGDDTDDAGLPASVIVSYATGLAWSVAMRPQPGEDEKPKPFVRISIKMRWVLPTTDGLVDWTLWTTSYEPTVNAHNHNHNHNYNVFGYTLRCACVTGSADAVTVGLKSVFGEACMNMQRTTFDIHYFLLRFDEMDECDTNPDKPGNEPCPTLCEYDKYCAHDPDGEGSLDGVDLVRQNLFQACLWKTLNASTTQKDGERGKWWDFVSKFESDCTAKGKFKSSECRTTVLNTLRLSPNETSAIDGCVAGCKSADECPILEAEIQARTNDADRQPPIFYTPTILVNKEALRGGVSCSRPIDTNSCKVLKDICMGFNDPPDGMCVPSDSGCDFFRVRDCAGQCHHADSPRRSFADACGVCMPLKIGDDPNPRWNKSCVDCAGTVLGNNTLDTCGICLSKEDTTRDTTCKDCDGVMFGTNLKCREASSISWGGIIAIVLAVSGVVGAMIYLYMRRQQNRMRDDIDGILKQYLPLDGSGGGSGNIRPNQRLVNGDDNL